MSLSGGQVGNGLASLISAMIGSLGINSYSSSIGLSAATGITKFSRSIAYIISNTFALLSLVPAAAAVFATIPAPVIAVAVFVEAEFTCADGKGRKLRRTPGLLNWLASRARKGSGGFGGGGFLFRDYQIGDGADLLRGEVAGRCQSHPGSIDRGVEPRFTQLVGLTRAQGQ